MQHNDTYDDGFSGGGLATVGAIAAGLKPIHAVEYDAAIADVYQRNIGNHVAVMPIQDVDWTALEVPYWRHMSPVCTRASQANSEGEESELDLEMARAVARSIAVRPPMFSLENVWQYRTFESFHIILRALRDNGYTFDYWHLNAAHYSVPQTRKRLILVASRVKAARKPTPTHAEPSELTPLFETRLPWVGWYAAIEDLIPTLPDSEFAPWHLERLPEVIVTSLVDCTHRTEGELTVRALNEPSHTIASSHFRRPANEPRAFIVDGQTNDHGGCVTVPHSHAPMYTLSATMDKRPRRSFVVGGDNASRDMTIRQADDPIWTLSASATKHPSRTWLQHGRVVRMTPRALARFQSVPDWYTLPNSDALACRVIGNGVPCNLMEAVITANRLAT